MIKKLVLVLAAGAAAVAFMVPVGSSAPDVSQLCTSVGDAGFSHGECVSLGQQLVYGANGTKEGQGATDAVGFCKFFDGLLKLNGSSLKDLGFTFGECVSTINNA